MAQKDIIINILKSYVKCGEELTAREIFQDMEPSEQGAFTNGHDQVSKVLCMLRDAGLVENGISNIVNGRSILTWKLSKHAQQPIQAVALDVADRPQSAQQNPETTLETVDAEAYFAEVALREQSQVQTQAIDAIPSAQEPLETYADGFLDKILESVESLIASHRYCIAEREKALLAQPKIYNKPEKIGLLNLLKSHYGYVNSDFETVLNDIIADLDHMGAA